MVWRQRSNGGAVDVADGAVHGAPGKAPPWCPAAPPCSDCFLLNPSVLPNLLLGFVSDTASKLQMGHRFRFGAKSWMQRLLLGFPLRRVDIHLLHGAPVGAETLGESHFTQREWFSSPKLELAHSQYCCCHRLYFSRLINTHQKN